MEDEYRIAKFKTLIDKIALLTCCWGGASEPMRICLKLIYDDFQNMNKYAKVIHKYFSWSRCQDKIEATTSLIRMTNNSMTYGTRCLFWALMVLAVDDTDKEKHLSLICDFARMLEVTDDEMKDLVNVIKRIFKCGDYEPIKTQKVRDTFNERFWDKF